MAGQVIWEELLATSQAKQQMAHDGRVLGLANSSAYSASTQLTQRVLSLLSESLTMKVLLAGLQPDIMGNIDTCCSSRCRALVKHDIASKHHKEGDMMMMSLQLLELARCVLLLVYIGFGVQSSNICKFGNTSLVLLNYLRQGQGCHSSRRVFEVC